MWYIKARKPLIEQVLYYGHEILHSPHMQMEREFMQHGTTNCYEHSICVAYMALRIAQKLRVRVDVRSLVRGCLLHDYFLYDWHDKDAAIRFHTFRHPKLSLKNAEKEFSLNKIEKDIILKHMFPLCAKLPKYRESFIITLADKCCAASEIWHLYSLWRIIRALERGLHLEMEQEACWLVLKAAVAVKDADGIKFLELDGVYPSEENIRTGSYPMTTELYAISLKGNENPNVKPFLEWMTGEQGRRLVRNTGYVTEP